MKKQSQAYILRQGESLITHLAAGQVVKTLADEAATAGGFGALVMDATIDPQPIPLHYHEKEHDTWVCTRGRLKVWCEDQCRILTSGDFAYVKPGDVHAYQSVAPRTQFFGLVAPGGWEAFFEAAGERWDEPGLPAINHPFDFSRMGPAMAKYDVHPVQGATYADVSNGDESDRELPDASSSYFLQEGYGPRVRTYGHLCTTLLSRDVSQSSLEMRIVEGPKGARMPTVIHDQTHIFLYMLEGEIAFTLGEEKTVLHAGDSANIPANTAYTTMVTSGQARWCLGAAHANGLDVWDRLGKPTQYFTPAAASEDDSIDKVTLEGVDARVL
ncbi:quercetin 2,3-dioxygenase family protein [Halomonas sp. BL6]|uniref:cupin domain-containing protein n=1 Tax=Halomonas sp. BL6 TaxID=2585770 RepID=UPI00111A7FC9|nr:quercetin 2,3-dioxygenase family protein [Halomonas sp. BL6]TNH14111.1 cupin domain-containing protein [Halomonas sp. BL6]